MATTRSSEDTLAALSITFFDLRSMCATGGDNAKKSNIYEYATHSALNEAGIVTVEISKALCNVRRDLQEK